MQRDEDGFDFGRQREGVLRVDLDGEDPVAGFAKRARDGGPRQHGDVAFAGAAAHQDGDGVESSVHGYWKRISSSFAVPDNSRTAEAAQAPQKVGDWKNFSKGIFSASSTKTGMTPKRFSNSAFASSR